MKNKNPSYPKELRSMLNRRGFVSFLEKERDLILPPSHHRKIYFDRLKNYSFRLVLRDMIKHQASFKPNELTRFCSIRRVNDHLEFLKKIRLIQINPDQTYRMTSGPHRSFGDTLEWFIAALIEHEFQTEAIWGIRFPKSPSGGDYDVIAAMEGKLVYVEVKSSPPKHIDQKNIKAFYNRIEDLLPNIAIFFVDTELRMKDKLVPLFEAELRSRHGKTALRRYPIVRVKDELFQIHHQVFIINSKREITRNFRVCFRDYWRSRIRV